MSAFDEAYQRRRPELERAVKQLEFLLLNVLGCIEDRKLVRAEFDDVHTKSLSSLKRKGRMERGQGAVPMSRSCGRSRRL